MAGSSSMLRTRVVTALTLLALLAAAAGWSTAALLALLALVVAAALFEWLRLAGLPAPLPLAAAVVLGVLAGATGLAGWQPALEWQRLWEVAAIVAWLTLAGWMVGGGDHVPGGRLGACTLALLLLGAAWWALVELLGQGLLRLLSVVALVWLADIAAYFAGRAFGHRKLAPHISPGKTWAGVWGAVAAVLLLAFVLHAAWPTGGLWSTALLGAQPVLGAALLVVTVGISVVGDLFESLVKRQAGAKDSSGLLPGHGGVWDRIDATLPVLPAAVLVQGWLGQGAG